MSAFAVEKRTEPAGVKGVATEEGAPNTFAGKATGGSEKDSMVIDIEDDTAEPTVAKADGAKAPSDGAAGAEGKTCSAGKKRSAGECSSGKKTEVRQAPTSGSVYAPFHHGLHSFGLFWSCLQCGSLRRAKTVVSRHRILAKRMAMSRRAPHEFHCGAGQDQEPRGRNEDVGHVPGVLAPPAPSASCFAHLRFLKKRSTICERMKAPRAPAFSSGPHP